MARWLMAFSVASFAAALGVAACFHDRAHAIVAALGVGSLGLLASALAVIVAARLGGSAGQP